MPDPASIAATAEVVVDTVTAGNAALDSLDKIEEDAEKNCKSVEDEKREKLVEKRLKEMEARRAQGLMKDDQQTFSRKR